MILLNKLKGIAANGAANLVEKLGEAGDKLFTNKEELTKLVNEHIEKMTALSVSETEAFLKDTDSARQQNIAIQTSDKASWLSKNLAYLIDILIVGSFIVALFQIFKVIVPEANKELFYTAFGVLCSQLGQIVSFHRGSSKSSDDKTKMLNRMIMDQK